MKTEAGNTPVSSKCFDTTHEVKSTELHQMNMHYVLKETDEIPGLDLHKVEKTTQPDLQDFHNMKNTSELSRSVNDVTGTQEIEKNIPCFDLSEKVKTQAKVIGEQKTIETEEINMRIMTGQQMISEEILAQEDNTVRNENNNQDKAKEHISAEETKTIKNMVQTDIVKPNESKGKLQNNKISSDIKPDNLLEVSAPDICKTKANETIAEMKELKAGDAENKQTQNELIETDKNASHQIGSIDSQHFDELPTTPPTQSAIDFFQNKDLSDNDIPTPKRPTTPLGKGETDFFQNREAVSEVDNLTAKRPARVSKDIQIIEDIRLPVMMDIEHIAARVDRLGETHEDDKLAQPKETIIRKKVDGDIKNRMIDEETSLQSDYFNNTIVTTTLTQKPLPSQKTVLYAQPDSTRIDHNDEIKLDANIETLNSPEKLIAENLNSSYPHLNLQSDSIEMALEQLDQYSQGDIQPFEDTVTSTSMKTPKDLIKILMQSPVQKAATVIASDSKTNSKKVGVRSAREGQKNITVTPERLEKTPIKRIKISPSHLQIDKSIVPQTPPSTPKSDLCSGSEDITINETLDDSIAVEHSKLDSNESSIVTKRCSLGNSDYQFEKVNDQIVLRVTRRGRRRVAPAPSVKK